MRLLVALSSCEQYERAGWNAARETWLPDAVRLGIDYRFFHGYGSTPKDDVVLCPCNDAYYDLTSKLKIKLKWALHKGYDYVFCCLADCYARPERLLTSGFDQWDYFGNIYCHPGGNPYCHGGPGMFVNRRSMEIVDADTSNYPNEDCWLGNVLQKPGIRMGHSSEFAWIGHSPAEGPLKKNNIVTAHLSNADGGYTPALMRDKHARWLESIGQPFKAEDIIPTWERLR